jgi:hypothetical protein
MSEPSEPVTLEFLSRQFMRFADDVAELKSQFVVQVAILQRVDAAVTSLSTEMGEVHNRLARIERRLRTLEDAHVP